MEPKPPSDNDRSTDDESFSNVVRLPTEFLGRRRELIPFGPAAESRARQQALNEAADRDLDVLAPLAASAFWGEESAALHHACEPSPTAAPEAGSDSPPCADSPTAPGGRRRDAAGWHERVSLRPRRLRGDSSRLHLEPSSTPLRLGGRREPWGIALAIAVSGIVLLAALQLLATPAVRPHARASLVERGLPASPLSGHPVGTPSPPAQSRPGQQTVNRARRRAASNPSSGHAPRRHSSARRSRSSGRSGAHTDAAARPAAGAQQSAETSAAQPTAVTPVSASPPAPSGSGYQRPSSGSATTHTTTPVQTPPTTSSSAHPSTSTLRSLLEGAGTCNC